MRSPSRSPGTEVGDATTGGLHELTDRLFTWSRPITWPSSCSTTGPCAPIEVEAGRVGIVGVDRDPPAHQEVAAVRGHHAAPPRRPPCVRRGRTRCRNRPDRPRRSAPAPIVAVPIGLVGRTDAGSGSSSVSARRRRTRYRSPSIHAGSPPVTSCIEPLRRAAEVDHVVDRLARVPPDRIAREVASQEAVFVGVALGVGVRKSTDANTPATRKKTVRIADPTTHTGYRRRRGPGSSGGHGGSGTPEGV